MKLKNITLLAAFCCFTICSQAQEFLWKVGLESVFDNREYNSTLTNSKTIFGVVLSPEVGIRWNQYHSLNAGIHLTAEFGSPSKDMLVDPTIYYNYRNNLFNVSAGLLPFTQVIGTESRAFFCDSVRFFKKTIGGVLLQRIKGKNHIELYFDWDGRQSDTRREKFTLYSSGRFTKNILFATYEISMHHHANTTSGGGVTDNVWLNPAVGVDLSRKLWLDSLTISAGYLQSFQNDRTHVGYYVSPKGGEINLRIEKFKFGIYNSLFFGDNMMPYFTRHGNSLYWGDPFYSTPHGIYNRLEVYWTPLRKKNFNLKIASIHHYDGANWSWQQFVKFCVTIDQNILKKKK